MFTKPIDEITFEDVKSFCKEWGEGVRVEYKRDMNIKKQIPKIVSSFANTFGGIFLIGVEADQTKNKVIFPIQGIPLRTGIEEQIQQSALTGIYPGVIPEIKLIDVPNSSNVVVVVRVDESVQTPHAIKDVTQVYIRVGSITQPYEYKLADMDRIAYMLKRREDSQVVARQTLGRIEARAIRNFDPNMPTLVVTAQPVFPYRPVISTSDIFELYADRRFGLRRVVGGISKQDEDGHLELNEYGIVYFRPKLYKHIGGGIDCGEILEGINELIKHTKGLYDKCEYLGNIEISIQLQEVLGRVLTDPNSRYEDNIVGNLNATPECFDTEVFAAKQCLARYFENEEKRKDIVEELTLQVIWAFNVPNDNQYVREKIRNRIERDFS